MRYRKAVCKLGSIEIICCLLLYACSGNAETKTISGIDTSGYPASFGFGSAASDSLVAAWDIDISPDGKSLPEGSGTVAAGKNIFVAKCAACHGISGKEGPFNKLVGAMDDTTKAKTIGNYWPYATTLFDYIRRTMPYNAPGSLQNDEVYSLSAFLLHANKIIDSSMVLQKENLPSIKMPAQKYFVADDRKGGAEIR